MNQQAPQAQQRARVLVVDDSRIVRATAEKFLGEAYEIVLAEDGEQAWQRIADDPAIGLVLTDIGMPQLDGYGLLARIRAAEDAGIRELPVIIITGEEGEEARGKALEHGADDFIGKPFNRVDLKTRVANHCRSADTAKSDAGMAAPETLDRDTSKDPVTQLGNARHFSARLAHERDFAVRHQQELSLARLAVDGLDEVAARYGEQAVTQVVRTMAELLRSSIRSDDTAAYCGEGTFALLLPACGARGAMLFVERLQERIAASDFYVGGQPLPITASIGVTTPSLQGKPDAAKIQADADEALRRARARGGNVVVAWPEPSATAAPEETVSVDQALEAIAQGRPEQARERLPKLVARLLPLLDLLDAQQRDMLARRLKGD